MDLVLSFCPLRTTFIDKSLFPDIAYNSSEVITFVRKLFIT